MGRSGRGNGRGSGRGSGNAKPTSNATPTGSKKTGLTKELGNHVFDYGEKSSADMLATSWEKFVTHIGQKLGEDIASELRSRERLVIPKPQIPEAVMAKHAAEVARIATQQRRLLEARNAALCHLELALGAADPGSEKAKLEIEIA